MFEFEWGNPSQIFLSPAAGDPNDSETHNGVHSYSAAQDGVAGGFVPPAFLPFYGVQHPNSNDYRHFETVPDPRAFSGASYPPASQTGSALASSGFDSAAGFMMLPKPEPAGPVLDAGGSNSVDRIGLNLGLGSRTYFSAGDENFLSRLYRRSRPFDGGLGGAVVANSPKCQAEGCNADLSNAKHYHRRHKVCEFHSKASTVVAGGLTQRFCQQCSRFHLLAEFDNGKRSCRRRLADHNRRRRKSHQPTSSHDRRPSHPEKTGQSSCSENAARSPSDSGNNSVSSMSAAVSPARISLDSLRSMQDQSSIYY